MNTKILSNFYEAKLVERTVTLGFGEIIGLIIYESVITIINISSFADPK